MQTNQKSNVVKFDFGTHQVRTLLINDVPYFVGKDVCLALGIINFRDKLSTLEADERGKSEIPTSSGIQEMTIINESGLYEVVFSSQKKEAKAFKRWVKSEVLPSIRKTGNYIAPIQPQLTLFEQVPQSMETSRLRKLTLDVALRCKAGTAEYKLVKALQPFLFNEKGGLQ